RRAQPVAVPAREVSAASVLFSGIIDLPRCDANSMMGFGKLDFLGHRGNEVYAPQVSSWDDVQAGSPLYDVKLDKGEPIMRAVGWLRRKARLHLLQ
ncbi:hypothetical protein EI555_009995, partial [Monodon monoceros]